MSRLGDTQALERIIAALDHIDPEIREEAVEAIGKQRDPRLLDFLLGVAADPDAGVRREVASAAAFFRENCDDMLADVECFQDKSLSFVSPLGSWTRT